MSPSNHGKASSEVVFTRLLDRRTVVLGSEINDETATRIISQLLLLAGEDRSADIKLYIDSTGGTLSAGLAIHDTMKFVPCDVSTWAIERVASVGHFILSSGTRGKRYATPTSLITLDCSSALQAPSGAGCNEQLLAEAARLVALRTGQQVGRVARDLRGGPTLTAIEARRYGLIDHIVEEAPSGPQSN